MNKDVKRLFLSGIRDGIPVGLGYFAVSFGLGITAANAGLTVLQAFAASLLNNASAGEYAGFALIASDAAYIETAVMIAVTNARYLLMSAALSQKFSESTPFFHRLLIGFDVTDELFGLGIARPGYLEPAYMYGAFLVALPGWACGTALGAAAGSILPDRAMSALGVAIYGMFIAIVIPPAKQNRVVLVLTALSFLLSFCAGALPILNSISTGVKTIVLTVGISAAAAYFFPIEDTTHAENEDTEQ